MSRKIILELADLEEHEWRLDDVFNQLAYLMVRIDDKSFNFDPMQLLTKAFSPGGVAANVKLPLESFMMIVQRLKAIRNEVDIRIMQNFWPLFHQIYLHVDDWNGAISHFINVHELWDRGQSLIPSKSMEKSYPKYESEFGTARQFIVYDPLDGVFSEQFHEHCRQLAFFMMLQPKRASKELTVAVLKSAHSLRNPRPINKLALFFHHAQAFAHYVVPEVKKQLPVALIYRMQEDTEALKDMNSVAKGDLLLQLCDRLTNDLVYNEYEKKATTTNTGPLDNAVLLQQRQWLLQLLAMGGCQSAAAPPPLAPHSHQQQQHVQHQQHVTSNHHHMFDEAAATSLSAALAAAATMLKKEVEEESPPVAAAAAADVFVFNKSQQQRAVKEAIGAMLAAKRRPKREPQQQQYGKHGDQDVQNVQQQRGQCQQQDRPQLGFSIDGLLKDVADSGTTTKSSPSAGQQAMIDYFMEEHELSWTDGRRGSRRGSSNNNNSTKTKTAAAAAKPALLEKQPPLPSASSTASSRPAKHVCLVCGKSYATSSNLSRHKQTHRPLDSPDAKKCSFCDRVYVSMPALSMHLLTHQARHKCALCGKLFSRPWLLKGHLRSHTGQKPFGCGNCGKAFSDRSNLRAHLNTHNSDKRWRCHRCGRAFALKSYLAKHLEQQHGADGGGRLGRMSSNSSAESTSGGGGGEEEEEEAGGTDLDAAMMVALPSLCDDDDDDEQMELERMELEQQQDEEEGGDDGIEGHNGD